jgi:hypothetical protein
VILLRVGAAAHIEDQSVHVVFRCDTGQMYEIDDVGVCRNPRTPMRCSAECTVLNKFPFFISWIEEELRGKELNDEMFCRVYIVESLLAAVMMFDIAKFNQIMFFSIMSVGAEFMFLGMSIFIDFAMAYAKIF